MIESYLIDSAESLKALEDLLCSSEKGNLCLDLETDSAQEKIAKIFGIGLSLNTTEAFYIPIRDNSKNLLWDETALQHIYEIIAKAAKSRGLVGWNVLYDVLVFENNSKIDISEHIYLDGMMLKHTCFEEKPNGLKECAVKFLGPDSDKAEQALYENIKKNGGSATKENLEMWKADTDVLAEYCCWDVVLTNRLIEHFLPQLKEQDLEKFFFEEEVMPLYKEVTVDMKRQGFPINVGYFEKLHTEITQDILNTEKEILEQLTDITAPFVEQLLNEEFPCKPKGNFPKKYAEIYRIPLPEKDGKITLAKKELEKLSSEVLHHKDFYNWLLGKEDKISEMTEAVREVQKALYFEKNPDDLYIFNLSSNNHLGWLFFEHLKIKPLSKTEGGKPQCDDDFLESIKGKYSFVEKLTDYKKLQKLDSTYIAGVLERHIDGILYSSFLQSGTTSGRYSSTNPNLQNLPRVKDDEAGLSETVLRYVNAIKKGFIAPKGCKIINADYSQLEPCCFAHASGDEKLRDVFRKGYDLYSQIAIDVFGLEDCSADKKAKNYLKKLHPEKRQLVKVFCLAVVYGAQARRISEVMGVDYKYAEEVIETYLDAYPQLREYMDRCDKLAKKNGYVKTEFGRIRHLPQAKRLYKEYGDKLLDGRYSKKNGLGDLRYTFKNSLNNAKNFPIQSTAATIVNRAMIKIKRKFKEQSLPAYIAAQVHDEITCISDDSYAERVKSIVKDCMENTTKISVPLQAEPIIGDNWAESK